MTVAIAVPAAPPATALMPKANLKIAAMAAGKAETWQMQMISEPMM